MTADLFRSKLGFNGVFGKGAEGIESREQKAAKTEGDPKERSKQKLQHPIGCLCMMSKNHRKKLNPVILIIPSVER